MTTTCPGGVPALLPLPPHPATTSHAAMARRFTPSRYTSPSHGVDLAQLSHRDQRGRPTVALLQRHPFGLPSCSSGSMSILSCSPVAARALTRHAAALRSRRLLFTFSLAPSRCEPYFAGDASRPSHGHRVGDRHRLGMRKPHGSHRTRIARRSDEWKAHRAHGELAADTLEVDRDRAWPFDSPAIYALAAWPTPCSAPPRSYTGERQWSRPTSPSRSSRAFASRGA